MPTMSMETLLILTTLLPLAGAVACWVLAPLGAVAMRRVALVTTVATLVGAGFLVAYFPQGTVGDFGYAKTHQPFAWFSEGGPIEASLTLGLDGLSLWLYGLSALLMLSAALVSFKAIDRQEPLFYGMLLLLECGCLGVFAAGDLLLFYVFFEFTLIPLFFLIGIWGSEQRRYAAVKFFLFTLAGSVLTFLGMLSIAIWAARQTDGVLRFSIVELVETLGEHPMPLALQLAVFGALFAGFAVKVPLFPLHTWLPLAHVQAPTAGSVILAGVLLKIGTYGFARFSIPMLPDATAAAMPWLLWLSVAGILYGALVALAQSDIKRLIAYSSVSHMGFCMLGLFALNRLGMQGAVLQMINHGISTGALFALVGMIYERYHTRQIGELGGLARRLPALAFFMVLFTLSSIGLPGLNGFTGEFLLLVGMFQRAWSGDPTLWTLHLKVISVLAVFGVILGAWYMLYLVQRVFFGPLREPAGHGDDAPVRDLSLREWAVLTPLAVFVFWIGLWPNFFLTRIAPTVNSIAERMEQPIEDRDQPAPARIVREPAAASHAPTREDSTRAD